MNKILIKVISFFLLILVTSCGYQIDQNMNNFNIVNIIVEGDSRNAIKLKNYLEEKNNKEQDNSVSIKINLKTSQTIKNKSKTGKALSYNLNITTEVEFIFANEKIKKTFTESSSYDLGTNHSTTIYNERKIKEQLLQKLADQIETFLRFKLKNVS